MIFNSDRSISSVCVTCSALSQSHLVTESSGFLDERSALFKDHFRQLKVCRSIYLVIHL